MIRLEISYKDPLSGQNRVESYQKRVGDILAHDIDNIRTARTISLLPWLMGGQVTPQNAQKELGQLIAP